MNDYENYLLSAFFFLILCALFYFLKIRKKNKANKGNQKFILDKFKLAFEQNALFDIKLNTSSQTHNGLSAVLQSVEKNGLRMETRSDVVDDWKNQPVEVFFKVHQDEDPVFYVFNSKVLAAQSENDKNFIILSLPSNLRVEKKRNFIRIQPPPSSIKLLAVWPISPGKRLPKLNNDLGSPVFHSQSSKNEEAVELENISASGIALRFSLDPDEKLPNNSAKRKHLLCLIVYMPDKKSETSIIFWCTGEIMNERKTVEPTPSVVLGLEFTNWAIQEHGSNEIHWAHSSPWRGVKPIAQWVSHIEAENK